MKKRMFVGNNQIHPSGVVDFTSNNISNDFNKGFFSIFVDKILTNSHGLADKVTICFLLKKVKKLKKHRVLLFHSELPSQKDCFIPKYSKNSVPFLFFVGKNLLFLLLQAH